MPWPNGASRRPGLPAQTVGWSAWHIERYSSVAGVTTPDGFDQVRRAYAAMWQGGADQPAGLVLATIGSLGVGVSVLLQSTTATAAWDRLAEVAPLTAVLLAGLWLLFKAYRALVERLIVVIDANTRAHTETSAAIRETAERIREMWHEIAEHSARIERLETTGRPRP